MEDGDGGDEGSGEGSSGGSGEGRGDGAEPDREGKSDSDASAPRDVGRAMVEDGTGIGSVAAHLYRGEVDRAVNWRTRLDATTNWAVTIIAGILAYAFSSGDVSHAILLVAMLIGCVFLLVEARRFRRYDIWRARVRSLQENLFANALDPDAGVEQRDWRRQLSEDYRRPRTKMPLRAALSHRLRRVYLPLQTALVAVWLFRLAGDDAPIPEAAALESAPGWLVLGVVLGGYLLLVAVALWPTLTEPSETDRDADLGNLDR